MLRPSLETLVETMEAKAYRVYDTPSVGWNLNIVGIRSDNHGDGFADTLAVFQRFSGSWEISYYDITTDPGSFSPRQADDATGATVLKEGQYAGAYALDVHARGRSIAHIALCQRLAPVAAYRYVRPSDRTRLAELESETGIFGIDICRCDIGNGLTTDGCQVFADPRKFAEFIAKCREGAKAFGNRFTYTLLHERDFQDL